jgi:hypothetical protein
MLKMEVFYMEGCIYKTMLPESFHLWILIPELDLNSLYTVL